MINLQEFLPTPHPSREVFKEHKFPLSAVAKFLGLTYNFTSHVLSGKVRVTPENDRKLKQLAETLQKESA